MREANVVPAAKAVAQRPGAERLNLAQFLSATADELGSSISADAFQPSLSWFWILLAVNLGTFALLKFYF